MWIANLKLIDLIQKQEYNIVYKMKKITKYIDLYRDLSIILKTIGYNNCNYRPTQITFTLDYLNKKIQVDDWNKYVLNRDVIEIRLTNVPKIYSLIDSFNKRIIIKSLEIKELYKYYQKYLRNYDCAILLNCDNSLLDVLDNSENYKNRCINRLIHRYKY